MDAAVFKQYYATIKKALEEHRLNDALSQEENILYTNPSWPFMDEVISIRQAYEGLLSCMEHGFQDDNRKNAFQLLLLRTYRLMHLLHRYYLKEQPNSLYSKTSLSVRKESYLSFQTILEKSLEVQKDQKSEEILKTVLRTREQCVLDLFNQIWTTGFFSDLDIKELKDLTLSPKTPKKDVLLILSALLLQQSLCPDARVFSLFLELSEQEDVEIRVRATVNWVLLLLYHEKEYFLNSSLKKQVQERLKSADIQHLICESINNFYLSLESRNLIQKLQNEILPLLNNEKLMTGTEEEAQKLIQSSMKKVQKLLNSGADVQFGSFMQDKNYPFFKQLGNWLLPFDEHHSETEFELKEDKPSAKSLKIIMLNPALCDNDKWSLFFKTITLHIPLQISGLNPEEMEMIDNTVTQEFCAINYIHDLFRVYNLFPFRMELINLLKQDFSPVSHSFLQKMLDKEHLFLLARVLFSNKVFADCITLAQKFSKDEQYAYDAQRLMADSYRLSSDYEKAIKHYEQACTIKQESSTYQLLAHCYKQTKNYTEAAAIYQGLLENDTENVTLCKHYVSCLIKNKDTEKAIPILYKIAYLHPEDQDMVQGALAYCFLLDDKIEEAWAAWEKISKKSNMDLLNGGHICWAMNDYKNAIEFYKLYLRKCAIREKAAEQMLNDVKVMKKYGLTKLELRLILEICHD